MLFRRIASRVLSGLAAGGAAIAAPAFASPAVALESAVFVEHLEPGNIRSLEPAERLSRGDRVVTVVTWRRTGGRGGFTVTNPLPRSIAYQASARENEEVSVDGGQTWGRLGAYTSALGSHRRRMSRICAGTCRRCWRRKAGARSPTAPSCAEALRQPPAPE